MGSDFDNLETPILNRYKDFNIYEGNSATLLGQSGESYSTSPKHHFQILRILIEIIPLESLKVTSNIKLDYLLKQ